MKMFKYIILTFFIYTNLFGEEVTIKYLNGNIKKSFNGNHNDMRLTYNKVTFNYLNGIKKESYDNGQTWIYKKINPKENKKLTIFTDEKKRQLENKEEIKSVKAWSILGEILKLNYSKNHFELPNRKGILILEIKTDKTTHYFKYINY